MAARPIRLLSAEQQSRSQSIPSPFLRTTQICSPATSGRTDSSSCSGLQAVCPLPVQALQIHTDMHAAPNLEQPRQDLGAPQDSEMGLSLLWRTCKVSIPGLHAGDHDYCRDHMMAAITSIFLSHAAFDWQPRPIALTMHGRLSLALACGQPIRNNRSYRHTCSIGETHCRLQSCPKCINQITTQRLCMRAQPGV